MATAAKKENGEGAGISGEYSQPDAAKAFEIYDKQIKPKLAKIDTARGELSQPWQDIKEHAHFPRPVMNFLIALENIEDEAKRDHYLLALSGGLQHRKLFLPRDLVTMADGDAGGPVVPAADRPAMKLVGVDDDEDPAAGEPDAGEGYDDEAEDFEEATEEELAQQEGRGEKPLYERMKELSDAGADETPPTAA